jgi:hypothetical protein
MYPRIVWFLLSTNGMNLFGDRTSTHCQPLVDSLPQVTLGEVAEVPLVASASRRGVFMRSLAAATSYGAWPWWSLAVWRGWWTLVALPPLPWSSTGGSTTLGLAVDFLLEASPHPR